MAGYRIDTAEALPGARVAMDPFHVVHLAAEKLTVCRQRIQQANRGHHGWVGGPLCGVRRILLTRTDLLTDKQKDRLAAAIDGDDAHLPVEVTVWCYQDLIAAYADTNKRAGSW